MENETKEVKNSPLWVSVLVTVAYWVASAFILIQTAKAVL